MLIDHADAERLRVARILHVDFGPVEQQGSLVGRIEAHHAFDESRLARAVLAQKRMKRARGYLDRDVVERGETPERLGHSDRFERRPASRGRWEMCERGSVGHKRASPDERACSAITATGPPPSGPWCSAPPDTKISASPTRLASAPATKARAWRVEEMSESLSIVWR